MKILGGPLDGREFDWVGSPPSEGDTFTVQRDGVRHRYVYRNGQWVWVSETLRMPFREGIVQKGV